MGHDRGSNFTAMFDEVLTDAGSGACSATSRHPMNANTGRWIGRCRRGLLEPTLPGTRHTGAGACEHEIHHNQHRPHGSLNTALPLKPRGGWAWPLVTHRTGCAWRRRSDTTSLSLPIRQEGPGSVEGSSLRKPRPGHGSSFRRARSRTCSPGRSRSARPIPQQTAWSQVPVLLGVLPLKCHSPEGSTRFHIRKAFTTWSPLTESNRRPSPYHPHFPGFTAREALPAGPPASADLALAPACGICDRSGHRACGRAVVGTGP
jgi:hypothetical protein